MVVAPYRTKHESRVRASIMSRVFFVFNNLDTLTITCSVNKEKFFVLFITSDLVLGAFQLFLFLMSRNAPLISSPSKLRSLLFFRPESAIFYCHDSAE